MPRYKVYYEGFYVVDAENALEAEDMKDDAIYDEHSTITAIEIDTNEMFV